MTYLARCCLETSKYAQGEDLLRKVLEVQGHGSGSGHPRVTFVLADLGENLIRQSRFAEAEPLLRECLILRQPGLADDWVTLNTKSLLGGSLLGQRKYAEAEPLLLQGYEGMHLRRDNPGDRGTPLSVRRRRLAETLEWLVQLCDAWGKKEEAAKWRNELEGAKAAAKPRVKS
jgi:hypothetical protein